MEPLTQPQSMCRGLRPIGTQVTNYGLFQGTLPLFPFMYQCPKCLCLNYSRTCDNCGEPIVPTRTQQKDQGGAPDSTQDPTWEAFEKAQGEAYSQEDTSEGLEYGGLLTDWVLGFREWRIERNTLVSPVQSYPWKGGVQKAANMNESEGGFYAYHPGGPYNDYRPRVSGARWSVWGAIAAKGDIYVYAEGFRAQYVKVLLLGFDIDWKWGDVEKYRQWAKKTYDCKICDYRKLRYEASKKATPIPESLRPKEEM